MWIELTRLDDHKILVNTDRVEVVTLDNTNERDNVAVMFSDTSVVGVKESYDQIKAMLGLNDRLPQAEVYRKPPNIVMNAVS